MPERILNNFNKFVESIKHTFTTLYGLIAFFFSLLLTSNAKMIFFFFVTFLILDYFTGIFASWVEHKESKKETEVYFVSSKRLRDSGVKVIGYFMIITFSLFLNHVFLKDGFSVFGVTPILTVVEIALSACVAIEFLSNLENLKRSGFDIIGKLSNAFITGWKLFRTAKGERNE